MAAPRQRPTLRVDTALAAEVPGLRTAAVVSVAVGALGAGLIVVQAVALSRVVDRSLLHHAPLDTVAPAIALVGVALICRAVLGAAGDLAARRAADRVVATLRGRLLRRSLARGPVWLGEQRPGELSVTATRGLRSLHAYYGRYRPQAAAAAVVPVLLLVWVASQDWLSLVVVIALVVAVPVTMIFFGREAAVRSERQWRRLSSLAGRFLLVVEGLPTLRAFGREEQGRREVAAATEGVRVATMRTLRVAFLSSLSMDMIAAFGVGFVAMALGLRLLWGELNLQTAMAVLLVVPEIFIPLRRAGAEFHASTEGQAAATRVLELLSAPEGTTTVPPALSQPQGATDGLGDVGILLVDDLRVDYPHRHGPALDSFTLHAPPGTRLSLVGPSGSGKSTVLSALLRLVEPSGGTMNFEGRGASDQSPEAWRRHFSWLPQRPHLFNTTLAENLRLGAPDATEADLTRVLDAVGLSALTAALPRGLETAVGHDGLTLSWGERQRVALARALLCPAPVLLLDEPTASLDPTTVTRLVQEIEPWLTGRTVIVAAHEPVLFAHFDAVVPVGDTPTLPVAAAP